MDTPLIELCHKYGSKEPISMEDDKSKLIIGKDFIYFRRKQ